LPPLHAPQEEDRQDAALQAGAPASASEEEEEAEAEGVTAMDADADEGPGTAVVLHEDKKFYPTADETYGPGTETLVQEEDAQPLEVPIVAPVVTKRVEVGGGGAGGVTPRASPEFLAGLLAAPELVRNVAVVGHLHAGKTLLMDMLVEQTHDGAGASPDAPLRFTDTRVDEQQRGISIKAVPMTLVAEGGSGKSYALSLMDCPGHVAFSDEACAAMRLADGVLLVVDAAEGVMVGTERAVRAAAAEGLPLCLVLTKVDRLIVELKLPPADAYHKLRHTVEEVNALVAAAYGGDPAAALDPRKGNVAFAAPLYGWSLTLGSAAAAYAERGAAPLDPAALAPRLWGDVWFHPDDRAFRRAPPAGGGDRSFVQFVLDPLYKLHAQVVGDDEAGARRVLDAYGAAIPEACYAADVRPLLKDACRAVYGPAGGLVDMLVRHLPSPRAAAAAKVERCYTGPQDGAAAAHMRACNPRGPLAIYVAKLFPKHDASAFDALGRVMSGAVKPGDRVRVLGEAYTPEDEEDCAVATVTAVWSYQARYRVPLARAAAGAWVLLEGLDATITKTATLVPEFAGEAGEEAHVFRPLRLDARAVVKIATEPLNPGELPKMVEGLRRLARSYPALVTKVEESGEHTIFGTGELYLDSAMRDLRELYADVEVKVADPVVAFCETVVETSSLKCFAETPNRRNKLTVVAEPLDRGVAEAVEGGAVSLEWPRKRVAAFFTDKFDWDLLAARESAPPFYIL
jgi:U5 small nuclear ribonucleoprotein component